MAEYWVDSNHMLQGPGVIHDLLPEANVTKNCDIEPWGIILHTNAGPKKTAGDKIRAFMARQDIVIEAHLLPQMDGTVRQTMPFNLKADCNYKGNRFRAFGGYAGYISFESQDEGYPTLDNTPYSIPQTNTICNIVAALGHKYGIPYTSPIHHLDRGVGYHSQFPEWSVYKGKTCPGAARIRQMDYIRTTAAGICAC